MREKERKLKIKGSEAQKPEQVGEKDLGNKSFRKEKRKRRRKLRN
jgi:hypothetical protein